jgi:hypothetical protein
LYKQRTATAPATLTFDSGSTGFEIAGIQINNQSDTWLFLDCLSQYIPPHTLAFSAPILPSALQATITAIASPSGGNPSVNTGTYTVTVYDTPQPASAGLAYDTQTSLVAISDAVVALQAGIDAIESNTGVGGTLETDLAAILSNSQAINTWTTNALSIDNSAWTNIAAPTYLANLFIVVVNNSANATLYVHYHNAGTIADATPIYPHGNWSIAIKKGSSLTVYVRADATCDVRQQYGTYS